MDTIIDALTAYYGLDWLTMVIGLCGTYMITQQKRIGFLLNAVACVLGLAVAGMSGQVGYIFYNAIILCMLSRTFIAWPPAQVEKQTTAEA